MWLWIIGSICLLVGLWGLWYTRGPSGPPPQHYNRAPVSWGDEPALLTFPRRTDGRLLFDWRQHVPPEDLDPNVDHWLQDLCATRRGRWDDDLTPA